MKSIEFSFVAAWRSAAQVVAAVRAVVPLALLCMILLLPSQTLGQGVHHPFAVGANEGSTGGAHGAIMGWILVQEAGFYRSLSGAIRAAKQSGAVAWGLAGLSFAYGIFHAAGPGHGKMVIASYMLANERALRRGLMIAFGAALLQGFSAVAIVGAGALVLQATAKHMTAAAHVVEIASYAGLAILGGVLVYLKGAALLSTWRAAPGVAAVTAGGPNRAYAADDCAAIHSHGKGCAHFHAPNPRMLGAGFSWKSALLTMVAAGLRPCSGAILVLVFALAQGIFPAGVFAVAAMSLGTAITTAGLASAAVFAKNAAVKYSKAGSRQALIAGRLFEAGAACAILGLALVLLFAAAAGGNSAS